MSRHLSGPALIAKCLAGRGTIIVVEGETVQDDEAVYNRWFADRRRVVTFVAQNGWAKVQAAVELLRQELPDRRVFGLIDRDFADLNVVEAQWAQAPVDGLYRGRRYTLENYLLEPKGLHAVVGVLFRQVHPDGWADEVSVRERIVEAIEECLPVTARNIVLHIESGSLRSVKFNHHARAEADVRQELSKRSVADPAVRPLVDTFDEELARLRASSFEDRVATVSGWAVLHTLSLRLEAARQRPLAVEDLISYYLEEHPDPPADITRIVDAILSAP